jgi:hypothetical protein
MSAIETLLLRVTPRAGSPALGDAIQRQEGSRRFKMKTVSLPLPRFAFVLGTRAALAAGIGLLAAGKLPTERRRAIGAILVAIGAVTTVPAAMSVIGSIKRTRAGSSVNHDERLVGATRFPRKGDDEIE